MGALNSLNTKVLAAGLSAGVAFFGQRLVTKSWRRITGEEPPDPADPEVPAVKAVGWLVASTLLVAVVQLLVQRFVTRRLHPPVAAQPPRSRHFTA